MPNQLKSVLRTIVDTLLPPRCIGTGDIIETPGTISPTLWKELSFIDDPMCACCGMPFAVDALAGMTCAACLDQPPAFDEARATLAYNEASRKLVLDFKYGDKMHAVNTFTPWLLRSGKDMIERSDAIIPVPLHYKRLWHRRYNQSAVLAASLAAASGKTVLTQVLKRARSTIPQKGLTRKERILNVKNAFLIDPKDTHYIAGRNILLVDDVFTSGATLNACAEKLKSTGCAKVFVLTIARVTREEF